MLVDVAVSVAVFSLLGLVFTPRVRQWFDERLTVTAATGGLCFGFGAFALRERSTSLSDASRTPLLVLAVMALVVGGVAVAAFVVLLRRRAGASRPR